MSRARKLRTTRHEPLLDEVRWRLFRNEELPARLRRVQRMESVARVWVNGREVGPREGFHHLSEVHD